MLTIASTAQLMWRLRLRPAKGLLHAALEFEKMLGAKVPTIPPDADLTGGQAIAIMRETSFSSFPGLQTKA
jgi:hypothetical protein